MFLLACSSSFAQKSELKELEKLVKNNNVTETKALLSTIEKMLPQATDDQKAAYYFFKTKNDLEATILLYLQLANVAYARASDQRAERATDVV